MYGDEYFKSAHLRGLWKMIRSITLKLHSQPQGFLEVKKNTPSVVVCPTSSVIPHLRQNCERARFEAVYIIFPLRSLASFKRYEKLYENGRRNAFKQSRLKQEGWQITFLHMSWCKPWDNVVEIGIPITESQKHRLPSTDPKSDLA